MGVSAKKPPIESATSHAVGVPAGPPDRVTPALHLRTLGGGRGRKIQRRSGFGISPLPPRVFSGFAIMRIDASSGPITS